MRQVVHASLGVDDRLKGRMRRYIADALAVDPDLAPVAQPGAILVTGSNHVRLFCTADSRAMYWIDEAPLVPELRAGLGRESVFHFARTRLMIREQLRRHQAR